MVTAVVIVRGTMLLAAIAWAVGELTMRRPESDRFARGLWTVGISLALIHVVLAFEVVYAWNHAAAVEATVRQAVERLGWGWRGGIYVNYLFLGLWLADVGWWWLAPRSHMSRATWIETTRFLIFAFMFLNGAVIFASRTGRIVGIASLALASIGFLTSRMRGMSS